MSESNDVERLARVLCEKLFGMRWDSADLTNCRRDLIRNDAKTLIAAGVTLSAPVAPRLTPLQAAADALSVRAEAFGRMLTDAECEAYARAVLAAAVGALTEDTIIDLVVEGDGEKLRAALLAALTEERA